MTDFRVGDLIRGSGPVYTVRKIEGKRGLTILTYRDGEERMRFVDACQAGHQSGNKTHTFAPCE